MALVYCSPESKKDWKEYYRLRWELLRAPLKMEKGTEKDDFEYNSHHIIAKDEEKIVGVGRVHLIDKFKAQIRYMAVRPEYRKKGVGKAILKQLENRAFSLGVSEIILNARAEAKNFYEKMGYTTDGKVKLLLEGQPHFTMSKPKVPMFYDSDALSKTA